jgi:hypothetical protein
LGRGGLRRDSLRDLGPLIKIPAGDNLFSLLTHSDRKRVRDHHTNKKVTDPNGAGRVEVHERVRSDQLPVCSTMESRSVEMPYELFDWSH